MTDAIAIDPRDAVFDAVHALCADDRNVFLLTNDMGAMGLDRLRERFPERVLNVGIAEQNLISVAAGLALAGKVVFAYGIASHVTSRCYEQLRLDVCAMRLPVVLLGIGSGLSYGADGPTHHGIHDVALMRALPDMTVYNPADGVTAAAAVGRSYVARRPAYIRMDKEARAPLYPRDTHDVAAGAATVAEGTDATVVATGCSVHRALEAARRLRGEGIAVRVVDCYRLSPWDPVALRRAVGDAPVLVTVEEHARTGGLGSLVAEMLAETGTHVAFRRLALGDTTYFGAASRTWAEGHCGIGADGIADAVRALAAGCG